MVTSEGQFALFDETPYRRTDDEPNLAEQIAAEQLAREIEAMERHVGQGVLELTSV